MLAGRKSDNLNSRQLEESRKGLGLETINLVKERPSASLNEN